MLAACHPDDLRALRDFAGNLSAAADGGVLLRAAWSGGGSCCGWEGVGCDGASGRVTALRLPGRGLAGPIPGASLAGLARLEELDLSRNSLHNISGALTVLRGCENLTTLILTKNFSGEELPGDGIGGFKSLEVLALGDCALRGTVPEWMLSSTTRSDNELVAPPVECWVTQVYARDCGTERGAAANT